MTTDGWQADNVDAYSSVTVHFIEKISEDHWDIRSALAGFTRLNNAHNGRRLGQALFKVVNRLGIAHRVRRFVLYFRTYFNILLQIGYVTCDNAKNNGTMLREFARLVKERTGTNWNPNEGRIKYVNHPLS